MNSKTTTSQTLCPFCQAGITTPITASEKYLHSAPIHPGMPMSRLCAIAKYKCGNGSVSCVAWDPSPTGQFNQEPPVIRVSHHLIENGQVYVERPRKAISYQQLAQAGIELVLKSRDTRIWSYDFEPLGQAESAQH